MVTVHNKDGDSCSLKMLTRHKHWKMHNKNETNILLTKTRLKCIMTSLTKTNIHFRQKTKTKWKSVPVTVGVDKYSICATCVTHELCPKSLVHSCHPADTTKIHREKLEIKWQRVNVVHCVANSMSFAHSSCRWWALHPSGSTPLPASATNSQESPLQWQGWETIAFI